MHDEVQKLRGELAELRSELEARIGVLQNALGSIRAADAPKSITYKPSISLPDARYEGDAETFSIQDSAVTLARRLFGFLTMKWNDAAEGADLVVDPDALSEGETLHYLARFKSGEDAPVLKYVEEVSSPELKLKWQQSEDWVDEKPEAGAGEEWYLAEVVFDEGENEWHLRNKLRCVKTGLEEESP